MPNASPPEWFFDGFLTEAQCSALRDLSTSWHRIARDRNTGVLIVTCSAGMFQIEQDGSKKAVELAQKDESDVSRKGIT